MPGSKRITVIVTAYASAPDTAVSLAMWFCRTVDVTISVNYPDIRQDQVEVIYEAKDTVVAHHKDDVTIVVHSLDPIDCVEMLDLLEREFRSHRHAGAHGIVQVAFLAIDSDGHAEWDRKHIPAAPEAPHSTTP